MIDRVFFSRPRVLVATLLSLVILVAVAVIANAGGGPPSNVAQDTDEAAAQATLSHPLPQIRDTLSGVQRAQLTMDQPAPAGVNSFRAVHQSYAKSGRLVARLDVWRGAVKSIDGTLVTLGSHDMWTSTKTIFDGSTDVLFLWQEDGLVYQLHVNLVNGIDQAAAERMAVSVR